MSAIRLVASGLAAALVMLGVQPACGQLQQDRPIRIVTSGFGGGTDFASRQLAIGLGARLGQNVVVENRGSSVVPGEVVSKASPDGHTRVGYQRRARPSEAQSARPLRRLA